MEPIPTAQFFRPRDAARSSEIDPAERFAAGAAGMQFTFGTDDPAFADAQIDPAYAWTGNPAGQDHAALATAAAAQRFWSDAQDTATPEDGTATQTIIVLSQLPVLSETGGDSVPPLRDAATGTVGDTPLSAVQTASPGTTARDTHEITPSATPQGGGAELRSDGDPPSRTEAASNGDQVRRHMIAAGVADGRPPVSPQLPEQGRPARIPDVVQVAPAAAGTGTPASTAGDGAPPAGTRNTDTSAPASERFLPDRRAEIPTPTSAAHSVPPPRQDRMATSASGLPLAAYLPAPGMAMNAGPSSARVVPIEALVTSPDMETAEHLTVPAHRAAALQDIQGPPRPTYPPAASPPPGSDDVTAAPAPEHAGSRSQAGPDASGDRATPAAPAPAAEIATQVAIAVRSAVPRADTAAPPAAPAIGIAPAEVLDGSPISPPEAGSPASPPAVRQPGNNDPLFTTGPDANLLALPEQPTGGPARPFPPGAESGHLPPALHHLPPGTGQRIAEAVAQFPDRPVEVTLTPEELGRVRMTLVHQDAGIVMTINADRPETLDLLRRNIDSLAQDFRDLGFRDLSFSFAGGHRPQGWQGDEATGQTPAERPETAAPSGREPNIVMAQRRLAATAAGGLDLRL